jgi:hypothetical protein
MARDWPTPMANDGCKPSAGNRRTADLTHVSRLWMTPTARDHTRDDLVEALRVPTFNLHFHDADHKRCGRLKI